MGFVMEWTLDGSESLTEGVSAASQVDVPPYVVPCDDCSYLPLNAVSRGLRGGLSGSLGNELSPSFRAFWKATLAQNTRCARSP